MPNAFHRLCRELGEFTRLIVKPVDQPDTQTTEVSRETEEKQLNETTTLRRTTIEEIEVKKLSTTDPE